MEDQKKSQEQTSLTTAATFGQDAISLVLDRKPVLTLFSASLVIGDTIRCLNIRTLVKTNGWECVGTFVGGLLKEFLSFVPNSLTSQEVVLYADNIMASFPTWSPEDLILCLKNGISGKYGPTPYHWKWNPNFIEWAEKYEIDKDKWRKAEHAKEKAEGAIRDAELIKMFPKELFANFGKVPFVDKVKEKMLDIGIPPDDVIAQGPEAVDAWVEKIRNKINKDDNRKI